MGCPGHQRVAEAVGLTRVSPLSCVSAGDSLPASQSVPGHAQRRPRARNGAKNSRLRAPGHAGNGASGSIINAAR